MTRTREDQTRAEGPAPADGRAPGGSTRIRPWSFPAFALRAAEARPGATLTFLGFAFAVAYLAGVLVFPSVVSAGFMVGGSHGIGGLRKGGKTVRHFRMTAASVGLLAGARSKMVVYLFMTDEALRTFEASSGWTVGADASVTVLTVGANAQIDTQNARAPVIGFVFTNAGLMGNLNLDGTRIAPTTL